jgi:hypothetical protein
MVGDLAKRRKPDAALPCMCSINPMMASSRDSLPLTNGCQTLIHTAPCRHIESNSA